MNIKNCFPIIIFSCITLINTAHSQDVTQSNFFAYTKVVIVSATQPWTDTNIDVTAGEDITIFVNGMASNGSAPSYSYQYQGWTGPEGWGGRTGVNPAPGLAAFCVIGKIGGSGTPFYVGRAISYKVNTTGRLYLGYNDDFFGNNYGYYVAFIITTDFVTSVGNVNSVLPEGYYLKQNYPNPFNPSTVIQYELPSESMVVLTVYNTLGQKVKTLLNTTKSAGYHEVTFNANNLASGIYFYKISAVSTDGKKEFIETKKLMLLK